MKVRNGFVSNSSTSSFLIYGVSMDIGYEEGEKLEEKASAVGLEIHNLSSDNGGFYMGKSWSSIEDNETGKQFKDKIEASIKNIVADPELKCETIEYAWHD